MWYGTDEVIAVAKSENQKKKILYLKDFLERETDADHSVSMTQILEYLEAHGVTAERKSVYSDVQALQEYGMDIVPIRGKNGGYHLASREFELPESFLQMMMEDKQLNLREAKNIRTGDEINLGGRTLEVLEVPGHTPGSIVLWDKKGNHLFTGDAIGSGNDVWMQWPSALPLDQYYPSLLQLLSWCVARGGRMKLLGGHSRQCFGSHLLSYNPFSLGWLCDLIDLVDQVLQGKIVGQPSDVDIVLETEPPLQAHYGRAMMQYMPSRIRTNK